MINNNISLIGLEKLLKTLANEELNNSNTPQTTIDHTLFQNKD